MGGKKKQSTESVIKLPGGKGVIEVHPLSDLNPAEYNPREISPSSFEGLSQSIKKFSLVELIVWNRRSGNIVGGHQRFKVLEKQGVKECPVIVVDLSHSDEVSLNITLNNPEIAGEFTEDLFKLLEEVEEQAPDDYNNLLLGQLGNLEIYQDEIQEEETFDADSFDLARNPVSKTGDLYQLGNHRLICGEPWDSAVIDKLIPSEKICLAVCHPPKDTDIRQMVNAYDEAARKTGLQFWAFPDLPLIQLCWEKYSDFDNFFVQDFKKPLRVMNGVPGTRHELIAKFGKGKFINRKDGFCTVLESLKDGVSPKQKVTINTKNLDVPLAFINHYSRKGYNVLDMFSSSGSTLIACEKTDRNCFSIEPEPVKCDLIVTRYVHLVGDKTIIKNGKKMVWK